MNIAKDKITRFVLIALITIIMLNVNGLVYLFTGSLGIISPIILLATAYLFFESSYRKEFSLSRLYLCYFVVYLLIGSSIMFFSDEIGEKALQTIFDILKTIFLIYAVYFAVQYELLMGKIDLLAILSWTVVLSVVFSYVFYVLGFFDNIAYYRTEMRLSGFFANPNELAAQAMFALICIKYLYRKSNKTSVKKWLFIVLAIISFVVLILAFSRSILIVFFLLVVIDVVIFSKISFKVLGYIGVAIVVLSIVGPVYYNSVDLSLQKRIDNSLELFEGDVSNENTGGRIELANRALDLIFEKPFLGLGIGYMQKMTGHGGVHNAYLAIWGNAGIIALLIFLLFIGLLVYRLFVYSLKKSDPTILYLILVIILNGITKTGVYEFKINNIIFALALAVLSIDELNITYKQDPKVTKDSDEKDIIVNR